MTAKIGTYSIDEDKGTPTEVAFVDTGDYNEAPGREAFADGWREKAPRGRVEMRI
jgi:hypothetical protein